MKIKKIKKLGIEKTYNLEMCHPHHNYILPNGMISKNSHSVAYAMLGYTMAWYKKHYPIYFYMAMMQMAHQEQKPQTEIKELYYEALKSSVKIKPPDINKSEFDFSIKDNAIYFGFKDLKGIGKSVRKGIEHLKGVKTPSQLRHLIKQYKINQSTIKTLIFSGAFDENVCDHYDSRYDMWKEFEIFYMLTDNRLKKIQNIMDKESMGFIDAVKEWRKTLGDKLHNKKLIDIIEKDIRQFEKKITIAKEEYELIGFPITFSLADAYRKTNDSLSYAKFEKGPIVVCAENFITIRNKNDTLFSMFDIYDSTDRHRAIYFNQNEDVHKKLEKVIKKCDVICVKGELSSKYGSFGIDVIYVRGTKSYVPIFDKDGIIMKNNSLNKLGKLADTIYK